MLFYTFQKHLIILTETFFSFRDEAIPAPRSFEAVGLSSSQALWAEYTEEHDLGTNILIRLLISNFLDCSFFIKN